MECTECKYRKQIPLKRCKHFELGGDKKRKVSKNMFGKIFEQKSKHWIEFELTLIQNYCCFQGQMIQF